MSNDGRTSDVTTSCDAARPPASRHRFSAAGSRVERIVRRLSGVGGGFAVATTSSCHSAA